MPSGLRLWVEAPNVMVKGQQGASAPSFLLLTHALETCHDINLVVHLQDSLLAEQMQQAADRAQKWKSRCMQLRQEIAEAHTSAASQQALLNVSLFHADVDVECW